MCYNLPWVIRVDCGFIFKQREIPFQMGAEQKKNTWAGDIIWGGSSSNQSGESRTFACVVSHGNLRCNLWRGDELWFKISAAKSLEHNKLDNLFLKKWTKVFRLVSFIFSLFIVLCVSCVNKWAELNTDGVWTFKSHLKLAGGLRCGCYPWGWREFACFLWMWGGERDSECSH